MTETEFRELRELARRANAKRAEYAGKPMDPAWIERLAKEAAEHTD